MSARTADCLFHEEQAFEDRRLRVILASLPLLLTLAAAARLTLPIWPAGLAVSSSDLIFLAALAWIVSVWLRRVRLVVDVTSAGVVVRLRGLLWRDRVPPRGWESASAVTFDARHEFGGYGLRRVGPVRAYVAAGTRGVRMTFPGGAALVVGSARPADLLSAIQRAAGRA